jgi:hypothetical protein
MATKGKEVTGWAGWVAFAAFMMILGGLFQSIIGLTAIVRDSFYVVSPNYLLNIDISTWGWIHFLWSLLVILAGFAILSGKVWGRIVGVIIAGLTAVVNMYYIPYYPIWSLLVIVVSFLVVYALVVHGDELAE